MISLIRKLRHGVLRRWSPVFVLLGRAYKVVLKFVPFKISVSMRIGKHGPFKLDGRFAFSNFDTFGVGKNGGLDHCVNAASGQSCVLDVGAHIGLMSLPMSQTLAAGGKIFAFEPGSFNRNMLHRHIKLNNVKNIEVLGDLVGGNDLEAVDFFEEVGDSPLNAVVNRFDDGQFNIVAKRQVSLDSFCRGRELHPSVMKIDVEGLELEVLKGAKETIAPCQPSIFLSVHRLELKMLGASIELLEKYIDEIGYKFCRPDGSLVDEVTTGEYLCIPDKG